MMGTGMVWGGWRPRGRFKTLVINAEDDSDEMRRRLYAAAKQMGIGGKEVADQVAIAESPETLVVAKADSRTKTVVEQPMVKQLVATVTEHKFDVLIVDPFAETFEGDENSNSELKWAAVLWRKIARQTDAAVLLVHHTRKFNAEAGDMDSARGGGALVGVARNVSTLFAMTEQEAAMFNVKLDDRHLYLRFDDAKANLTLVTHTAKWFKKLSVKLPNGGNDDEPQDEVGVLDPWIPQSLFARTTNDTLNSILDAINLGVMNRAGKPTGDRFTKNRAGANNKRWAGDVIRSMVDATPIEAQRTIDTRGWKNGTLEEVEEATTTSRGVKLQGADRQQSRN